MTSQHIITNRKAKYACQNDRSIELASKKHGDMKRIKEIGSGATETAAFIITLNKINVVLTHNVNYTNLSRMTQKKKKKKGKGSFDMLM